MIHAQRFHDFTAFHVWHCLLDDSDVAPVGRDATSMATTMFVASILWFNFLLHEWFAHSNAMICRFILFIDFLAALDRWFYTFFKKNLEVNVVWVS